jgi:hypothetical protein
MRYPAIWAEIGEKMRRRKTAAILLGLLIGISAAAIASSLIRMVLQVNDPAYQCARSYIATHEFRIGDKPMSELLAKTIARQCEEQVARMSVMDRFDRAHPLTGPLLRAVVFLFDPMTLVLEVIFSSLASVFLLRAFRGEPPGQGEGAREGA